MTEKNIFADQFFLSLNISDFILNVKIATHLSEKSHPLFSSNPPLKVEVLSSSPPFLKIWLEARPLQKKGGVHTIYFDVWVIHLSKILIFTSNSQGVVG